MKRAQIALFLLGLAALATLTVYAGAGAVLRALVTVRIEGLLVITATHLPSVALLALAWWLIGRDVTQASLRKFLWARFLRDATAEVLPFSQAGGFAFGVRALHLRGVKLLPAALSMSIDLVVELWAKIPYIAAGLLVLLFVAPASQLVRALAAALVLTIIVASVPVLFRGRLWNGMKALATRLAGRWPEIGVPTHDEIEEAFAPMLARRDRLFAAFGVHLFGWFYGAFETWVILAFMGLRVGTGEAVAIDSLVSALRTFAFLVPAAAGVQEASYVLICGIFGLPPAVGVAVSFARRARDILLGAPTFAVWQILEASARPASPADVPVSRRR